jgi:hypothetical protein
MHKHYKQKKFLGYNYFFYISLKGYKFGMLWSYWHKYVLIIVFPFGVEVVKCFGDFCKNNKQNNKKNNKENNKRNNKKNNKEKIRKQ